MKTAEFKDAPAPAPAPDLDYSGRVVKVGFWESDPDEESIGGEWMFVQVHGRRADGSFHGTLLNEPIFIPGLRYGDEVGGFDARHIYSVEPSD